MALIAARDGYAVDGDGIRRKISAGAPIPKHLAATFQEGEVETREVANAEVHEPAVSRAEGDNEPHPVTQERQRAAAKDREAARRPAAKAKD